MIKEVSIKTDRGDVIIPIDQETGYLVVKVSWELAISSDKEELGHVIACAVRAIVGE